jgi:hypothetical protein
MKVRIRSCRGLDTSAYFPANLSFLLNIVVVRKKTRSEGAARHYIDSLFLSYAIATINTPNNGIQRKMGCE